MEEFFTDYCKEFWNDIPEAPFTPKRTVLQYVEDAPSFHINKIAAVVRKIYTKMLLGNQCNVGEKLCPDTCRQISMRICAAIKYPTMKYETVYQSLYPTFMTQDITTKMLYQMAYRIAGNIEMVRRHEVIPRWEGSMELWVPVDVVSVKQHYCKVPAKELLVFITAGAPAGGYLTQEVSSKFLQYMMREIGYPRYKVFDSQEVYNLKFTTKIVREHSKIRMIAFNVSSAQRKANMNLYKMRHGGCPFEHPIECTDCLKGLLECPGSLHRDDYFVGDCVNGHRGVMDGESKDKCMHCVDKEKREEVIKRMENYGK